MRNPLAVIALTLTLVVVGTSPASAATSPWASGGQFNYIDRCPVSSGNSARVAFADEGSSCPGVVGVRAKITRSGSVSYTHYRWHASSAVITFTSGTAILLHQAAH